MADLRVFNQRSLTLMTLVNVVLSSILLPVASERQKKRPHIILILADDLGWNDIGFHNPDILTPNLDDLAVNGIILNQSYVQPVCSPSRSSIMTGIYPFRMGLQHLVFAHWQPACLPLDKTILPQVLRDNGYNTHMIGKWHLGFCDWRCTPLRRGFESFYGYYGAAEDFYNKRSFDGFDFREDEQVKLEVVGNYSTYQYMERAKKLIDSHNDSNPFFLYYALQSVHDPLEAPDYYVNMYQHVKNRARRTLSAMVTAMDDLVGELVRALKAKGMYENSVIMFSSDNGGHPPTAGNNLPLRGAKCSLWEGGTRAAGFIHSPMLNKPGVVYDGIFHAVDWFPTLLSAANISYHDDNWDGVDQWEAITNLQESKRTEFVYNLDNSQYPLQGRAAIRVGDYKLIEGFPGIWNDWHSVMDEPSEVIPDYDYFRPQKFYYDESAEWIPFQGLYNLRDDPEEKTNLYHVMPDTVTRLKERLNYHWMRMMPVEFPGADAASHPDNFGGVWNPGWCRLNNRNGQGQCPGRTSTWTAANGERPGFCTLPRP